jgi:hypothetical protein
MNSPTGTDRHGPFMPPGDGGDTDRDVHVSRGVFDRDVKLEGEPLVRTLLILPMFGIGIVWTVLAWVSSAASGLLGISFWWVFVLLTLAGAWGSWVALRRRTAGGPAWAGDIARARDESYRLALLAYTPEEVGRMGEIRNDPFEPVIVPVLFPLRGPGWAVVTAWLLAAALVWFGLERFQSGMGVVSAMSIGGLGLWASAGLAALPLAFLWPTYLRVSPGRLDVMRYGLLGMGGPRVTTFDLRTARVVIHLDSRRIQVSPVDGTPAVINLGMVSPRRYELARAVLEAARWRGEVTPLPGDALVG